MLPAQESCVPTNQKTPVVPHVRLRARQALFDSESKMTAAANQVVEEAKVEARRRGNAETQTSDARFDERFQLGYGLTGACCCNLATAVLP